MAKKLPVDELLRLACIYAERDQQDFVAAFAHIPEDAAAIAALAFVQQLRAYRLKRWGRTRLEKVMEEATPTDFTEIASGPNHAFSFE